MQYKLYIFILLSSVLTVQASSGRWDESKYLFGNKAFDSSLVETPRSFSLITEISSSKKVDNLETSSEDLKNKTIIKEEKTFPKRIEETNVSKKTSSLCKSEDGFLETWNAEQKISQKDYDSCSDEVINFHAVEETYYHGIIMGAYAVACYGGLWLNSYCNLDDGRCSQELSDGFWALGVSGGFGLILSRARIEGWI